MAYIYKFSNKINGKEYIGATVNWKQRYGNHKFNYNKVKQNPEMLKERKYRQPITKAFYEFGFENFNFEILEECKETELKEREKFYISKYDTFKNGYNSTEGGDSPYNPILEQDKENIIKLYKKGYNLTDISKKIHKAREVVARILEEKGLRKKGETKFSNQEENIIELYQKGATFKDIAKMVGCSKDTAVHYCKKNGIKPTTYSKKKVIQKDKENNIINVFESQMRAAKYFNQDKYKATANHISECCLGKRKTAKGYYWEYFS